MFGHQTVFDDVWSPNIYRLSRPLVSSQKYSNIAIFWRLFGFYFKFLQFPSVKFSDMLKNRVESGKKKLLKSEKVGVVKAVFSFLAFFVFFG